MVIDYSNKGLLQQTPPFWFGGVGGVPPSEVVNGIFSILSPSPSDNFAECFLVFSGECSPVMSPGVWFVSYVEGAGSLGCRLLLTRLPNRPLCSAVLLTSLRGTPSPGGEPLHFSWPPFGLLSPFSVLLSQCKLLHRFS